METNPDKQEDNRNEDGTFKEGVSGNLQGRPKGKTIKERVKSWLEDHPEDMQAFVEHFVKENKELAWQMLEGKPPQTTDITSAGKPIPLLNVLHNSSDQEDIPSDETD